jgi:hypothetical protein
MLLSAEAGVGRRRDFGQQRISTADPGRNVIELVLGGGNSGNGESTRVDRSDSSKGVRRNRTAARRSAGRVDEGGSGYGVGSGERGWDSELGSGQARRSNVRRSAVSVEAATSSAEIFFADFIGNVERKSTAFIYVVTK